MKAKKRARSRAYRAERNGLGLIALDEDRADALVVEQRRQDRTLSFEHLLKKYGYRLDSSNRVVR